MSAPSLPAPGLAHEMRSTGRLALPLVIGHVSAGLVGFVDNVIAGHHGTATLAAVTTGTALMWLPLMVPIGTLVALAASVSHHDGAGEHDRIGPLFRQALWLAAGLGLAMFVFLSLIPHALAPMGIAPEIVPGARDFLHGISSVAEVVEAHHRQESKEESKEEGCQPADISLVDLHTLRE